MEQFMDCMCDDNLSSLIVSGNPSVEELAEAWASIFYEYCDLVEHRETMYRHQLTIGIKLQKTRVELASEWIKILEVLYVPKIAKAMQDIGFDYEFNHENQADYKADIARIRGELMFMKFDLRTKEAEYESLITSQSTKDTVDRKYFHFLFDKINDHKKREAITEKSKVMQFAIALNRYYDAIDSQVNKFPNARV